MTAGPVLRMSYADYLALEASSERKHEYLRGEAWAMAGGTIEHSRLQANIGRELGVALAGKPCVVLTSDAKVRIDETDRSTYPDASVVCGPRLTSPIDRNAIINPVVIVEVLSESTERDDRGEKFDGSARVGHPCGPRAAPAPLRDVQPEHSCDKFAHYRRLASLEEYVLVSQDARRIEVFRRTGEGWMFVEAGPGQELTLRSIGVTLNVDAVYFARGAKLRGVTSVGGDAGPALVGLADVAGSVGEPAGADLEGVVEVEASAFDAEGLGIDADDAAVGGGVGAVAAVGG